MSDLYSIHSDLIEEGEELASFMGLGTTLPKNLLSHLYIFLSTAPSERGISLSLIHPSSCSQGRLITSILGRKSNLLQPSREQSQTHLKTPNILHPFSPSEGARSREASYDGGRSTMLHYHIKVKSPFRLVSAHAQLLEVSVTIYGSIF